MRVPDCVEDGHHYNEPCDCPIYMSLGSWVRLSIRQLFSWAWR